MARPGRRCAPQGRCRPAAARRPEGSLDGAAGCRQRRCRDPGCGAPVDTAGSLGPAAASVSGERPWDPAARRVQFHARAQRLLGPSRRTGGRALGAETRGRRRLPGSHRLPGLRLVGAARQDGARARRGSLAGGVTPGLRRPRSDDRAPRHRRRSRAAAPPGTGAARNRRDQPARRRTCGCRPRRFEPRRASRHRAGRHPRRRRGPGRNHRRGDGRLGAADPHRGLAT